MKDHDGADIYDPYLMRARKWKEIRFSIDYLYHLNGKVGCTMTMRFIRLDKPYVPRDDEDETKDGEEKPSVAEEEPDYMDIDAIQAAPVVTSSSSPKRPAETEAGPKSRKRAKK